MARTELNKRYDGLGTSLRPGTLSGLPRLLPSITQRSGRYFATRWPVHSRSIGSPWRHLPTASSRLRTLSLTVTDSLRGFGKGAPDGGYS
ncbi:MAG: hypothetical protein RIS76_165 [Verrucomicrobiota bacterium]|jgi:hypothetical protein